jgi:hypothetical protein
MGGGNVSLRAQARIRIQLTILWPGLQ